MFGNIKERIRKLEQAAFGWGYSPKHDYDYRDGLVSRVKELENKLDCIAEWRDKHIWISRLVKERCPVCGKETIMEKSVVSSISVGFITSSRCRYTCYKCDTAFKEVTTPESTKLVKEDNEAQNTRGWRN